jgi:hypothetical protein
VAFGKPSRSRRNAGGHGLDSGVRQHCVLAEAVGVVGTVGDLGADGDAAPPADYTDLLIAPDALGLPGEPYSAQVPTQNPQGVPGVSTVMVNRSDTRSVGDTIYLLPDPDAATTSLKGATQSLDTVIATPAAQPAPVGDTGTIATGDSLDGTKAMTVVMFTRGRAFVTMVFGAAPGQAITSQLATQAAQGQDAIVKDKAPI